MTIEEYSEYEQQIIKEYLKEIDDSATPEYILDQYFSQYTTIENFITELLELNEVLIPNWVKIDYEKTWDQISDEFDVTCNFIFYK